MGGEGERVACLLRGRSAVCYSARIVSDYRRYVRMFGATVSLGEFVDLFWRRANEPESKIIVPKGVEAAFDDPKTDEERQAKQDIDAFRAQQATKFEQELFKQRKRLADAERTLASKTTKAAIDSKRIATEKVERLLAKLGSLRSSDLTEDDVRVFPGHYAPVMVWENGQRVVKPMRYQCRPQGKPPHWDTKYPGTYNARRDNLSGEFWRGLFGYSHGVMVIQGFYEHVKLNGKNAVLEFSPRPSQDMLVACLWSRWTAPGEADLLSFAAITDEPPAEIAAAGHDRCVIPIKPENVDAWLNPEPKNQAALYAILDERARPYYEHRLAA
jgi:putative SOS response-associated peptidase YedK